MWDHPGRRIAIEGEELIVHRFRTGFVELVAQPDFDHWKAAAEAAAGAAGNEGPDPGLRPWQSFCRLLAEFLTYYGFVNHTAAPSNGEPGPVVEIRPDSLLRLRDISQEWQGRYHFTPVEDALFIDGGSQDSSGRALCFGNGTIISWQSLREGQKVTVLRRSWLESLEPQPELVKVRS
jgi:hypothetical protein